MSMVSLKPIETPATVAQAFVNAMKDYFAETDTYTRDAIAAHQLDVLRRYQGPRDKPLRLSDVKDMFVAMKDIID